MNNKKIEVIAYYLGQFHPIEENNRFWGDGFTEWHNVAKARPLFPGHIQPKLPGKLSFYDLRCEEVLMEQMLYARSISLTTFCFWHYWFGGKRILHDPMDRMLALPDVGLKFMLGWANESWSGIWHGASNNVFIEQTYGDFEMEEHAKLIAGYIKTERFLTVDGKYPFVVYKPRLIPDAANYLTKFKQLVKKHADAELYIIGNWGPGNSQFISDPHKFGLDAVVITPVAAYFSSKVLNLAYAALWKFARRLKLGPEIRPYSSVAQIQNRAISQVSGISHATVVTGWDNTPRSGRRGLVLTGYNKDSFSENVSQAYNHEIQNKMPLLFVKSWNEWAEGNVIEPFYRETWSAGDVLSKVINQ